MNCSELQSILFEDTEDTKHDVIIIIRGNDPGKVEDTGSKNKWCHESKRTSLVCKQVEDTSANDLIGAD